MNTSKEQDKALKKNGYLDKVNHILPIFLLLNVSSVLGFLLIRWLLVIQYTIIDVKEEVWELWIPMVFPWLPITIWLRRRLRVLAFKKEADNRRFFFQFIAWATIAVTMIISQAYLSTVSGKLEFIQRVEEISLKAPARYYKVGKFMVDTASGSLYVDVRTSGKYDEHLNFDVFFTAPMVNDTSVRFSTLPKAWYGIKYQKQISNKISQVEKERKYQDFMTECIENIKQYSYSIPDHFESLPTSDDKDNFRKAIQERFHSQPGDDLAILLPVNEPYESRNGNKLIWIFGAFGIGISVFLFSLIWPGFSETEHRKFIRGQKPKQDDLVDMLKFLIPSGDHFMTSIILDLNIIVFVCMMFSGINIISPNGQELLGWGANRHNEVMNGQWWRLITNVFVHGGIMHLFVNIYGLVIAALFLEPILGRKKYLILYLISGIVASISSVLWYENTVSVGASGAIFGLYGAILALLLTDAFEKAHKKGLLIFIGIYVVINLLWGLTGGIDNAAHVGGLISGAFLGVLLYKIGANSRYEN